MADGNDLKVKHDSISSCSDDERRNSNSTFYDDQIDGRKLTSRQKKKVKVPWNVLENEGIPNEAIALTYFSKTALRHVFELLDSKDKRNGRLAKTRLQVICANLCMVFNITHNAQDLVGFNGDKAELTFDELINYLEAKVLTKADKKVLDMVKLDRAAWDIISKEEKGKDSRLFTDNDLFKLWQIFNKLTQDSVTIDVEEASLFLQSYMTALGTAWDRKALDEFTLKTNLTFWDLINCLETKYIQETPESVFLEGLETLSNKYIGEIIKSGWLNKKGHRVKSIKARWFVFTPHLLNYYETSRMSKKKGEIYINMEATVENIPDSKHSKCRFSVLCGVTKKVYELEAADQRTKNEWISVIKQCIAIEDGVTPLMVELSERADKRKEKERKESRAEVCRLEHEEFVMNQMKELEVTRLALDQANIQTEAEAALKEEEKRRREEVEALKAEYEKLLDEEKQAREEEKLARERQQEILAEETSKRLELERIKSEQDEILAVERKMRESLEELSKEQAAILEEERERLKLLAEAYKAAEAEVEAAHAKLEASENESRAAASRVEEAKERTRLVTGAGGLNKTIGLSLQRPTTHRGAGAFTNKDFSKTPLYLQTEGVPVAVNRSELPGEERAQILAIDLVKPSEGRKTFEKDLIENNT